MDSILNAIVDNKRREIEAKAMLGIYDKALSHAPKSAYKPVSMSRSITDNEVGIIAEFKRRSPSRGDIHPGAVADEIVKGYTKSGAAACSILTDTVYFGGALSDLALARKSTSLPLLRKEFIVDSCQIFEARIYGADAILLIASILSFNDIVKFTDTAHQLGMEVLLELHDMDELDRFNPEVDMVGINNRNLSTFVTDTDVSLRMASALPDDIVKVAESGLSSIAEIHRLRDAGYRGFLIGETFMKHQHPGNALKDFINATE